MSRQNGLKSTNGAVAEGSLDGEQLSQVLKPKRSPLAVWSGGATCVVNAPFASPSLDERFDCRLSTSFVAGFHSTAAFTIELSIFDEPFPLS